MKTKEEKKEYRLKNKDKINVHNKEHRQKPEVKKKRNISIKCRKKNDQDYYITLLMRTGLYKSLNHYSKTGKIQSASKYGINYKKIIEHLKPFPKNINKYHVDHIIPLNYFNFNNKEEIKWAWAPENLQWLRKELNLWKGNRFILAIPVEEQEQLLKELNLS